MEIQQCKASPRFPLESRLSQSHSGEWKRFKDLERHDSSGKRGLALHCCISITDKVKINNLQKSIATGLLYVISILKRFGHSCRELLDFEPLGVLCLVTSARSKGKTPKSIFIEKSGVARSVRNRTLLA